jgi:hypothetical protein
MPSVRKVIFYYHQRMRERGVAVLCFEISKEKTQAIIDVIVYLQIFLP